MDIGDALGVCRGLGFVQEGCPLRVGGKHDIDQAVGSAGRFLRHPADAGALRQPDVAVVGRQFARDQAQ